VLAAVNAGNQDTLARLGHSGLLDLLQPGGRMNVELLDTAGDAAVMSRLHLVRADGEPARVLGQVAALRDGVATTSSCSRPTTRPVCGLALGTPRRQPRWVRPGACSCASPSASTPAT
jgi:hypothetical protein